MQIEVSASDIKSEKRADDRGRVTLGSEYAASTVTVAVLEVKDEDDVQEDTGEVHTEHGHDVHPDANLEAGEVLVVYHSETTEYIWAARADADDPYILRVFDDGEEIDEVTIGVDEAFRLVRLDSEKRQTDSVTVETPLEAAANGGGSE